MHNAQWGAARREVHVEVEVLFAHGSESWFAYPPFPMPLADDATGSAGAGATTEATGSYRVLLDVDVGGWGSFQLRWRFTSVTAADGATAGAREEARWSSSLKLPHGAPVWAPVSDERRYRELSVSQALGKLQRQALAAENALKDPKGPLRSADGAARQRESQALDTALGQLLCAARDELCLLRSQCDAGPADLLVQNASHPPRRGATLRPGQGGGDGRGRRPGIGLEHVQAAAAPHGAGGHA